MKGNIALAAAFLISTSIAGWAADEEAEENKVVDALFVAHKSPADFSDALHEAEQAGVSRQLLFEAKINYYLVQNYDLAGIRKIVRESDAVADVFDPQHSKLFESADALRAAGELGRAIIAWSSEQPEAFKEHITEAIWLNPDDAEKFAALIKRFRSTAEAAPGDGPAALEAEAAPAREGDRPEDGAEVTDDPFAP